MLKNYIILQVFLIFVEKQSLVFVSFFYEFLFELFNSIKIINNLTCLGLDITQYEFGDCTNSEIL